MFSVISVHPVMPEKFPAHSPDYAGFLFLEPDPAQKLPDMPHPVRGVLIVQVGGGRKCLLDVLVHALKFKRIGKIGIGEGRGGRRCQGHGKLVAVNGNGLGKIK